MLAALPLLALPVLLYNVLALTLAAGFAGAGATDRLSARLFTIPMASHAAWGRVADRGAERRRCVVRPRRTSCPADRGAREGWLGVRRVRDMALDAPGIRAYPAVAQAHVAAAPHHAAPRRC